MDSQTTFARTRHHTHYRVDIGCEMRDILCPLQEHARAHTYKHTHTYTHEHGNTHTHISIHASHTHTGIQCAVLVCA